MAPAKVHTTAVVFIPPAEVWEPIQEIRRRHDPHLDRWMPHVTLLYPFWGEDESGEAEARLEQAGRAVMPFAATLERLRHFPHGHGKATLWLEPKPRDRWRDLQRQLEHYFPDCDDVARYPRGFTAHLSVGEVTGRERRERLLRELNTAWSPLTFSAATVSLIARTANQPFRVVREFPFGR